MRYTLREAADVAKVHRSTIHRHIKEGRLSAERQDDNTYRIDASELARVFPPDLSRDMVRGVFQDVASDNVRRSETQPERPETATMIAATQAEVVLWRTRAEMLERLLESEREKSADLGRRLDAAQEAMAVVQATMRETVAVFTRQLPPPASEKPQERLVETAARVEPARAPKGFLDRLLGR